MFYKVREYLSIYESFLLLRIIPTVQTYLRAIDVEKVSNAFWHLTMIIIIPCKWITTSHLSDFQRKMWPDYFFCVNHGITSAFLLNHLNQYHKNSLYNHSPHPQRITQLLRCWNSSTFAFRSSELFFDRMCLTLAVLGFTFSQCAGNILLLRSVMLSECCSTTD